MDISHAGTIITMSASNTFPAPFPLTYFPDDTDPFSVDDLQIADGAMGTNGHEIYWATGNLASFTISVIPDSPDHLALATIFNDDALRRGKVPARNIITFNRVMPGGNVLRLSRAKMTSGTPFLGMASSGRLQTVSYTFMAPPKLEIIVPQL